MRLEMSGDACDDVNETHERKQIERQTADNFINLM